MGRPFEGPWSPRSPSQPQGVRSDRSDPAQGRHGHHAQRQAAPRDERAARHARQLARHGADQARQHRDRCNAEHRFRSEDKVDRAALEEHKLKYTYRAGDEYHFMNTENYEMVSLHATCRRDRRLPDRGHDDRGLYYEGRVVGIEPPMFVELAVKDTTPNIKGAAVQNTAKPAMLETGLEIKVPAVHRDRRPREDRHAHGGVRRARVGPVVVAAATPGLPGWRFR